MENALQPLKYRYITIAITLLVLMVISQFISNHTINKQNEDAWLINIAGHQRMLSQRISKAALYINNEIMQTGSPAVGRLDTLKVLLKQWNQTHKKLIQRNKNKINSIGIDSLLRIIRHYLKP